MEGKPSNCSPTQADILQPPAGSLVFSSAIVYK